MKKIKLLASIIFFLLIISLIFIIFLNKQNKKDNPKKKLENKTTTPTNLNQITNDKNKLKLDLLKAAGIKKKTKCDINLPYQRCQNSDIHDFWSTYNINTHFFIALEKSIYPSLKYTWSILKVANDMALEGKLSLHKCLQEETLDLNTKHRDEIVKRLKDSIQYSAKKSNKVFLKIFSASFLTVIKMSKYKLPLKTFFKLVRKHAKKLKELENNQIELYQNKIKTYSRFEIQNINNDSNNIKYCFDGYELKDFYNIENKGKGPLKKNILFKNKKYDASYILKLLKYFIPSKIFNNEKHLKIYETNQIALNGKYSGIFSLLKAYQINSGNLMNPNSIKYFFDLYENTFMYIPEITQPISNIIYTKSKINDLSNLQQKAITNLSAIVYIILREGDILKDQPILPKDFYKFFKQLGIKLFAYNEEKNAIDKIIEITTNSNPKVVTCLIHWSNDKNNHHFPSGIHYFNIIHYDKKNKLFLIDDTNKNCYWIEKNYLGTLMKLNIKKPLLNFFTQSQKKVLYNIFGGQKDVKLKKALNFIEKTVKKQIGGTYGFFVADPKHAK